MNIGIYIYDQAEVLDFSGPFEVFCTASRICTNGTPFTTFLVSQTGDIVNARGGYKVVPDYGFHNHPAIDLPIIVGGVHTAEMRKSLVINWIAEQARTAPLTAAVTKE